MDEIASFERLFSFIGLAILIVAGSMSLSCELIKVKKQLDRIEQSIPVTAEKPEK